MAINGDSPFCSAVKARSLVGIKNAAPEPTEYQFFTAIYTAINTGFTTATVNYSGKPTADVQNTLNLLRQLGYTVTVTGTTALIAW